MDDSLLLHSNQQLVTYATSWSRASTTGSMNIKRVARLLTLLNVSLVITSFLINTSKSNEATMRLMTRLRKEERSQSSHTQEQHTRAHTYTHIMVVQRIVRFLVCIAQEMARPSSCQSDSRRIPGSLSEADPW